MINFGLCCLFKKENIKFRRTTAKALGTLSHEERSIKLSDICLNNAVQLFEALKKCKELKIRSFRILSPLLPLYTHPVVGYTLEELNCREDVYAIFNKIKEYSSSNNIRTSFHPDQFILLSSPDQGIVDSSIRDLNYHAEIASLIGADVINIHAGGGYGDKNQTIERLLRNIEDKRLESVREYLTFENDDRIYTPEDILRINSCSGVPFVYDVHHHRCNPDALTIKEATESSILTWEKSGRKPLFHISSPKEGWNSGKPQSHSDYIDVNDFPVEWLELKRDITLDVEAKAKELAVLKLHDDIKKKFKIEIGLY